MISKCQNIVINRTKFSDFQEFDTSQSTEGLKLVGYIETYDQCKGEVIKQNVAVEYPNKTAVMPSNCVIADIVNGTPDESVIQPIPVSEIGIYTVKSNFEGETILINFNKYEPEQLENILYPVKFSDGETRQSFNLSFSRSIPTGKEIKVIFNDFPMSHEEVGISLIDYSYGTSIQGSINSKELLINGSLEFKEKEEYHKSFIITFVQTLKSGATSDNPEKRKMVATRIEMID